MTRGVLLAMALLVSACAPKTGTSQRWREDDTSAVDVHLDLIEWYIDNGMPTPAMTLITNLREKGVDAPQLILFQGRALATMGLYTQAEPLLLEARSKMPRDPRPMRALGLIYAETDRIDDAISAFKLALDVDDRDAAVWNNLGWMLLCESRCTEAHDALQEAISRDGTEARYRNNLAMALACEGSGQAALRLFRTTMPEAEARYNLGVAFERFDNVPGALLQYQQALEIDPEHESSRAAVARLADLPAEESSP